jgi:fructokinase
VLRIGVDIGGTKTEVLALDAQGNEALRRRVPTPHGGYEQAIQDLAKGILAVERELGEPSSVGICLPGMHSQRDGLVHNSYATPYNRRPFKYDLEQLLDREIRIGNDANCFALSEAADGAARGHSLVFGAILGTGAGGGIVLDGRILAGGNGFAGEWGHNPLPWMTEDEFPGPRCTCGRLGCIEQFVSGPALAADHARTTGESRDPAAIAALAQAGEPGAVATMRRLEGRLARALAHVINLIDPDVVVLGGGLSNIARLYAAVPKLWGHHAYFGELTTPLVQAAHGDASGVRGAARLWDH